MIFEASSIKYVLIPFLIHMISYWTTVGILVNFDIKNKIYIARPISAWSGKDIIIINSKYELANAKKLLLQKMQKINKKWRNVRFFSGQKNRTLKICWNEEKPPAHKSGKSNK